MNLYQNSLENSSKICPEIYTRNYIYNFGNKFSRKFLPRIFIGILLSIHCTNNTEIASQTFGFMHTDIRKSVHTRAPCTRFQREKRWRLPFLHCTKFSSSAWNDTDCSVAARETTNVIPAHECVVRSLYASITNTLFLSRIRTLRTLAYGAVRLRKFFRGFWSIWIDFPSVCINPRWKFLSMGAGGAEQYAKMCLPFSVSKFCAKMCQNLKICAKNFSNMR